jgi:hypothetical protein
LSTTAGHHESAQPAAVTRRAAVHGTRRHTERAADEAPWERNEDSTSRRSWALLAVTLAAQILVVLDISVGQHGAAT